MWVCVCVCVYACTHYVWVCALLVCACCCTCDCVCLCVGACMCVCGGGRGLGAEYMCVCVCRGVWRYRREMQEEISVEEKRGNMWPEARCPARRMLVNAREWRNNSSWSGVAYTTSGLKARSNARWRGRSLTFKTRWRMCFSGFRTSRSPSFVFMKTFSLFFFFFWQTEHVQLYKWFIC